MSLYNKITDLQKLRAAWQKVRANKPANGTDGITWEAFEANAENELKKLHSELQTNEYECRPVKIVVLYKNEKERPIALYCMRDKVLQQSIAEELSRLFEPDFSLRTYAYRKDSSAQKAVLDMEEAAKSGRYAWALKSDIHQFFENIRWEILERALRKRIHEDDVLHLIQSISQAPSMQNGEWKNKNIGVYQGSSMSPVLSNIYLSEFDRWMMGQNTFFVRYSDDLAVLTESKEKVVALLTQIDTKLQQIGLMVSESKTIINKLENGVGFLGYVFNTEGKQVGAKAQEGIAQKLETAWFLTRQKDTRERLQKLAEIYRGWEQYYAGREPSDILEYAVTYYMEPDRQKRRNLSQRRWNLVNPYQDLSSYFIEQWKGFDDRYLQFLEYEQRFSFIWRKKEDILAVPNSMVRNFLAVFEKVMGSDAEEDYAELLQLYTDAGQLLKASVIREHMNRMKEREVERKNTGFPLPQNDLSEKMHDSKEREKFYRVFCGRDDMYASVDILSGKKKVSTVTAPLTQEIIDAHLAGKDVIATFVQRNNSTARFFIIDVDISRRITLQCKPGEEVFEKYREKAAECVYRIGRLLCQKGMSPSYEYSGYRGYHIWLFFDNWYPVRYFNLLQDLLEQEMRSDDLEGISIDFFSNKTRIKPGYFGQCIKLPLCFVDAEGHASMLLDSSLTVSLTFMEWEKQAQKHSIEVLKKALSLKTEQKGKPAAVPYSDISKYGKPSPNVEEVLTHCSLMKFICAKASQTGYLVHGERLSVLYVFGHLGEEGKSFVHQVMSFTLNYDFNVTDKFIRKLPEKPVSCPKLREQYKTISAELGCGCTFRHRAKCYPSPVLHAVTQSKDVAEDITLPISSTMTKQKEQVLEEVNVHKKAQAVVAKILEKKKQFRALNSAITKLENELDKVFEEAGVSELEVESGLLVRKEEGGQREWVIEL